MTRRLARLALTACVSAATALAGCATADPSLHAAGRGKTLSVARDLAPAPRKVPKPKLRSGEYRRSWGLNAVNANSAYRAGATGQGVVVALIDSGLDGAQPEVVMNASKDSIDLIENRKAPSVPAGRHGGQVAGTLASALNGQGLVGVAYEATVLSIRADIDGACARECAFKVKDVARGIDYAVAHKARVIILAVQGTRRMHPEFEAALERATKAGVAVIIAAGNEGGGEVTWPARYAADARFSDAVIAVGASNLSNEMAAWSNKAGSSMDNFLIAPGHYVVTDCGEKFCTLASGTSYSAPFVAGAVALLLDRYPSMTGPEAVRTVLAGARDMGAPGVDPVYGHGILDVGGAFRVARDIQKAAARGS